MNLSVAKPEEVIKPEYLDTYLDFHQDIYNRLLLVNTSIRIFDTIKDYPLGNLYGPNQGHFFFMVYWNFLYSSIVLLNGIINDSGNEVLTINHFKNQLLTTWIKDDEDIKDSFREKLRQVKFTSEINELSERIRILRNNVIAHRVYDKESERRVEIQGVSFPQLKKVYKAVEGLFEACCFGAEYFMSFYPPTMENPEPPAEDVQEILDLLVKNSGWLNLPEKLGVFWPGVKQHIDRKDIEELNKWRKKYNMLPA